MTNNNKGKGKSKGGGLRKIKGKGDYEVGRPASAPTQGILGKLDKVLARIPKGAFAAGGSALGARMGGSTGATMGRKLGAGLSAISGYGDYDVKTNSLSKVSTSSDMVPQFVKNDHSCRVVHREYIKDLIVPDSPTSFSNTEYVLNPANATLFPWLARMAKQYSQYKIHGMVFVYKTMTSDYAASGPLGTIIMATNYNSVDRAFVTKVEMENSEFAVSCKPSMNLIHAIECDASVSGETILYVRDPAYETTDVSDKRFYDFGKFQMATAGLPGSSTPGTTLGEVWVSYDVEFLKPIVGGDTLLTPCPNIVGGFNGSVSVVAGSNPSGRVPSITFNQLTSLMTNAPYSVSVVSNAAYTPSGDVGLEGTVVNLTSNGNIILRKNGRYTFTFRLLANTTTSNYAVAAAAVAGSTASIAGAGTALGQITTSSGRIANAVFVNNATNGYESAVTFEVYISGIADGTGNVNYATVTPHGFTTSATFLIPSVSFRTQIAWLSVGQGGQSVNFAPSAYP